MIGAFNSGGIADRIAAGWDRVLGSSRAAGNAGWDESAFTGWGSAAPWLRWGADAWGTGLTFGPPTLDVAKGFRRRSGEQESILDTASRRLQSRTGMERGSGGGGGSGGYGDGAGDAIEQWRQQLDEASRQHGVPVEVLAAIMEIESTGNPAALSPQGAVGLMQVMPNYHQARAAKYGGDLRDPRTNIQVGAEILAENQRRYGNWESAAAAYLGAVDDTGQPTTAADAHGTTGIAYVDRFRQARDRYQQRWSQAQTTPATRDAADVVNVASRFVGTPYVWGGSTPAGFDCSGLIQYSYGLTGKQLPRTSQQQYAATQRIAPAAARPGDLVFFNGPNGEFAGHVGIYIGNGQMLNAPSEGDTVRVMSLSQPYWQRQFIGFGRVT